MTKNNIFPIEKSVKLKIKKRISPWLDLPTVEKSDPLTHIPSVKSLNQGEKLGVAVCHLGSYSNRGEKYHNSLPIAPFWKYKYITLGKWTHYQCHFSL